MNWLLLVVLYGAGLYAIALLALIVLQRRMMYLPEKAILDPVLHGLPVDAIFRVPSDGGVTLVGWHVAARPGFPTIVYYHGNAGHLGHRIAKFQHFTRAGFGLVAGTYRGYGESDGMPTEAGILADARAMIMYTRETVGTDPSRIILYGESLGTGVAVRMASEIGVGGIVLEAPYTSVADRAGELYPWAMARRLIRDKFHSLSYLPAITAPLLILHGEQDRTIPVIHGRRMLEAAAGPKRGIFYPHIGHTDFDFAEVTRELMVFSHEHGLIDASA